MFDLWLKSSPTASWTDIIRALKSMNEISVASRIEASCSGNSPEISQITGIMHEYELLSCVEYFVCLLFQRSAVLFMALTHWLKQVCCNLHTKSF